MPPLSFRTLTVIFAEMSAALCHDLSVVSHIAVALTVLVFALPAAAQPLAPRTALVVDAAGAPVPGASVWLVAPTGEATPLARTSADGRFAVPSGLPPGAQLRVERPPFAVRLLPVPQPAAADSGTAPLRIVLTLSAAPESVIVAAPLVDATSVDSFGSTRTVVSDAQVRDLHALDLASALRRTPGVTISRFSPVGTFGGGDGGAVFVRGTGASRPGSEIVTTIDGVPFYMGIWGHPLLGLLPVNGIDRITVLKGPQPQGVAGAFAAVDVETRRARTEGMAGDARFSVGAFGTVAEQGDVTWRAGRWDVAAAQGFTRSDGHRPDADGRMANAYARAGLRASDAWGFEATVLHVDSVGSDPGEVGRPETKTGRYETNGTLVAGTIRHVHGPVTGALQLYANRGDGDWFNQPAPDGDTLAAFAMTGVRWRGQLSAWSGGRISGGLDVQRTSGEVRFNRVAPAPQTTFDAEALTLVSPSLAVDHGLAVGDRWNLTSSAGLRIYGHSVFERTVAPHAGLVARRNDGLALHASYARGVHYPGQEVVALSSLIPPLGASWRALAPEQMDHVEAGVSLAPTRRTTADLTVFDDRITNRYVFGFPPAVARPAFVNLGGYRVRGAELTLRQAVSDDWQAFGGLTLLDPSLDTLPYAPARALVAGVTGRFGRFSLAVDAQAQSSMFVLAAARTAGAANMQQVDGFAIVNVRPAWRPAFLDGRGEVFAAIENLFDEAYAYRPGYPMPGVSAQVGIRLHGGRR